MSTSERQWAPFIVVATMVVAAVIVSVWMFLPRADEPGQPIPDSLTRATRSEQLAREVRWSEAPMVAAYSESAAIASAWHGTVRDVDGLLTEDQKVALLASASKFVHAYSSESPDQYIALVESTPWLRWRTGADELRGVTAGVYKYFIGRPPDDGEAGDAIALLRRVWPKAMVEQGMRLDRVGSGEYGALFAVQKTYSASPSNGLDSSNGIDVDYWDGVHMHAYSIPFTTTSKEYGGVDRSREVLPTLLEKQERASLTVVFGHVLVKAANGVMFNWQTRWVLDPMSGLWICDEMVVGTGRPIHVFF